MNTVLRPVEDAERVGDDVRAVLDALRHIVRALRIASRAAEKRVGLSGAQLFALHKLADGRTLSLGELAARTLTHQSSISVVVQRLVERGLVRRQASRADGRRTEVTITSAGRARLRRAPQLAQEELIAGLKCLGASDRRNLARMLTRLIRQMGSGAQAPSMFFEEEDGHNGRR